MRVELYLKMFFFSRWRYSILKGPSHNANDAMVDLVINENKIETRFKTHKYTGKVGNHYQISFRSAFFKKTVMYIR